MKALSIRQPWAWLIVHGFKPVENRTWSTSYRGELAIHAARTFDQAGLESVLDFFPDLHGLLPQQYDLGGVIGVATVEDCVQSHPSGWFIGPWGICLRDPHPFPFLPFRGVLGLFEVPDELLQGHLTTATPAEVESKAGQERPF